MYAHCLRGAPGGVTLLVIDNSRTETAHEDAAPNQTLHVVGRTLRSGDVDFNGAALEIERSGNTPARVRDKGRMVGRGTSI